MVICTYCSEETKNYCNRKDTFICWNCSRKGVVVDKCKIHDADMIFSGGFLNGKACCKLCDNETKTKFDNFRAIPMENHLMKLKERFPMFKKIEFATDDECIKLTQQLKVLNDQRQIYNMIYDFLNTRPNYKLLTLSNVIILTNWIKENSPYPASTDLCHLIMPCIYDHYECMKSNKVYGQDRLNYYRYKNVEQLFYIWTWCRLSKSKNMNHNTCYICLDEVSTIRDVIPNNLPIVPNHNTDMIVCLSCGTYTHTKCTIKDKKAICRICNKEWENCFDFVRINEDHMLHYFNSDGFIL